MYYFLKEDFEELGKEIEKICDKIKEIGQEMGRSCKEGAETFHDNFAYEDGERQQYMWSNKLRELINIRNNSRIVETPQQTEKVSIGKIVTVLDQTTNDVKTFKIGSYMIFKQKKESKVISYNSPLARLFINSQIGDIKKGMIGGKNNVFKILNIK